MIELEVMPAATQVREAPDNDLTTSLGWRSWQQGLQDARATRKPVFCVAENRWGNAAQRLALFLEKDDELVDLISTGFIPVLVDPGEMPDLVDRILMVAMQVESTVSPPLLAICTEEGLPLVTSCDITFEGTDDRPSLMSLLRATEEQYAGARKECLVEARGLQQNDSHAARARNLFLPGWRLLRQPDEALLRELVEAGIHDQLVGDFHRASRQASWGVPHFEKLGAQNAAMAVVLLRSGRPEYSEAIRACSDFAMRSLKSGSAGLASDTPFYTWASEEVLSSLPAEELQMVGLHFRITAGSSRHVLNQVRSVGESVELATGPSADLARERLASGKRRLLAVRNTRQLPEALPAPVLAAELTALGCLIEVARHDSDLADESLVFGRLAELLEGVDFGRGGLQRNDGSFWLHDQVAALSTVMAARAVHRGQWEQHADEFVDLLESHYQSRGAWLVSPGGPVLAAGWFDADLPAVQLELQKLFPEKRS